MQETEDTIVLVVDDEQYIRDIMKLHLEGSGFRVILSEDGEAAINVLKNQDVSVTITDIKMPKVDGFGVLKYIRENKRHIPVIMLTGYVDINTAVDAMKKGSVDYLTKPIKKNDLINSIEFALGTVNPNPIPKPYEPSQIYLMRNDGITIFHYTLTGRMEIDSDIFGSMFTAIKMFIKDSFKETDDDLRTIEHGRFKVLIEEGGDFFLVVIGIGEDTRSVREKMKKITQNIEARFGKPLAQWTGDMRMIDGIEKEFEILGATKTGSLS